MQLNIVVYGRNSYKIKNLEYNTERKNKPKEKCIVEKKRKTTKKSIHIETRKKSHQSEHAINKLRNSTEWQKKIVK
jgi:hypothetical protein